MNGTLEVEFSVGQRFSRGDQITLRQQGRALLSSRNQQNPEALRAWVSVGGVAEGVRFFGKREVSGQTPREEANILWRLLSRPETAAFVPPSFVFGHFVNSPQTELLLVQECPGRPLEASDAADAAVLKAVVGALVAINNAGVRYLDVKHHHIFVSVSDGRASVRFIDFGLAVFVGSPELASTLRDAPFVGTPAFASVFQHFGEISDPACDFQSLCFLFALLGNEPLARALVNSRDLFELALIKLRSLLAQEDLLQSSPWMTKARKICEYRADPTVAHCDNQDIAEFAKIVLAANPGVGQASSTIRLPDDGPPSPGEKVKTPEKPRERKAATSPHPPSTATSPPSPSRTATSSTKKAEKEMYDSLFKESMVLDKLSVELGVTLNDGALRLFSGQGESSQVDILTKVSTSEKMRAHIQTHLLIDVLGLPILSLSNSSNVWLVGEVQYLPLALESRAEHYARNKLVQLNEKVGLALRNESPNSQPVHPLALAFGRPLAPWCRELVGGVFVACRSEDAVGQAVTRAGIKAFKEYYSRVPFLVVLAAFERLVFESVSFTQAQLQRSADSIGAIVESASRSANQALERLTQAQLKVKDVQIAALNKQLAAQASQIAEQASQISKLISKLLAVRDGKTKRARREEDDDDDEEEDFGRPSKRK